MSVKAISPIQAAAFRERLQRLLSERIQRNRYYSLRRMAQQLDMDASVLSKLLRGKRGFSPKMVIRIGTKIGMTPAEIHPLVQKDEGVGSPFFTPLPLEKFSVISHWYHFALLELLKTTHKHSTRSLAKGIALSETETLLALERMEKLQLVKQEAPGIWQLHLTDSNTTGNNFHTAEAYKNLQRGLLEKARDALEDIPFEERDNSSLTIAVGPDDLPLAKEEIRKFRRRLSRLLGNQKKDRVYNLSLAFFPVSAPANEESTVQ